MQFMTAMLLVAGLVGCGPSNAEMRTAKATEYKAPAKSLLDIALQVTQRDYQISPDRMAFDALKFATDPQWYTQEGGRISPTGDANGEFVRAGGGDVNVTLVVQVRPVSDDLSVIEVTAKTFELVGERNDPSPKPRELAMDDLNLPPWVLGRVDKLAYEIWQNAKQYSVGR